MIKKAIFDRFLIKLNLKKDLVYIIELVYYTLNQK